MSDEGKTPPGALPPPPINRKAVLLAVFIAFGKGDFDAAGCSSLTMLQVVFCSDMILVSFR